MISKFYDADPLKENTDNQNASLLARNLTSDLWTQEGKYKASTAKLIEFEADSWFTDSYELVVLSGSGSSATQIKLVENTDYFLGEEDVELGSSYRTALGVRLQDTPNVRKARERQLVLRAWVARQNLKARDLNEILVVLKSLSS